MMFLGRPDARISWRALLVIVVLPGALALPGGTATAQRPTRQEVRRTVFDGATSTSVEGAMVLLFDTNGRRVNGMLSGTGGFLSH